MRLYRYTIEVRALAENEQEARDLQAEHAAKMLPDPSVVRLDVTPPTSAPAREQPGVPA